MSLQTLLHLAILVHACANDRKKVEAIGEILGYPLPVPDHVVCDDVMQKHSSSHNAGVGWYAMELPVHGASIAPMLTPVAIFAERSESRCLAGAQVFPFGRAWYRYPRTLSVDSEGHVQQAPLLT